MPTSRAEENSPTPPPDAFFPGVPRVRVVLLGIVLIIAGAAGFVFLPQVGASPTEGASSRTVGFLLVMSLFTVGLGIMFIVRKPQAGSPPGSLEHERLIAEQQAQHYRSFTTKGSTGLALSALLVLTMVPLGVWSLTTASPRASAFFVIGGISLLGSIGFALMLIAARRGRLKHVRRPVPSRSPAPGDPRR